MLIIVYIVKENNGTDAHLHSKTLMDTIYNVSINIRQVSNEPHKRSHIKASVQI